VNEEREREREREDQSRRLARRRLRPVLPGQEMASFTAVRVGVVSSRSSEKPVINEHVPRHTSRQAAATRRCLAPAAMLSSHRARGHGSLQRTSRRPLPRRTAALALVCTAARLRAWASRQTLARRGGGHGNGRYWAVAIGTNTPDKDGEFLILTLVIL
jgi:hypothetical protein